MTLIIIATNDSDAIGLNGKTISQASFKKRENFVRFPKERTAQIGCYVIGCF
ncbi:MAG: hypothetical protein WC096_06975 [Sphaerochaetaceae bacterium]